MKKNGFTLVEVMAIIVILAILLTLGTGVYYRVYENQQQKTYENKVSMIELSAEKWASESNLSRPITITVQKLIDDTYYQADRYDEANEEYIVEDPRDKSSLLCNTIDIVIDNGTPTATMNETKDCNLKDQEEDARYIHVYPYQYNPDTNQVGKALTIDSTNTIEWTRTAVLLLVNPDGKYKNQTYSKVIYSSGANATEKEVKNNILNNVNENSELANVENYANVYVVDASLFLKREYTISLETPVGIKSKDVYVQIDKEAPTIDAYVEGSYTTSEKDLILRGSDGAGSGLKGFYVSTSPTTPGSEFIKSEYEAKAKKPNGTYYIFAEDNVGNISEEGKKVDVSNIDASTPICQIQVTSGTQGNNNWYTSNVTITMTSSAATGTGLSYALTTSQTPSYDQGILREGESVNKSITLSADGTYTYYGYVKNSLGATASCTKTIKLDKTAPECKWSGESTTWKLKGSRTISLKCLDETSKCVTENVWSKTYSSNKKTDSVSETIWDNAGNSTTCSKTIDVYVDACANPTKEYTSECINGSRSYKMVCNFSKRTYKTDNEICDSGGDSGGNTGGDDGPGSCCMSATGDVGACNGICDAPGSDPRPHCCTECKDLENGVCPFG